MMIAVERAVIENGSRSEMRSAASLAELQKRGALSTVALFAGYWLAGAHGYIKPYSEGNYILTEKGEGCRLALPISGHPLRQ